MFLYKTGCSLDELRGKRVLDAGCGMERFAEICADAGAEAHAVDLSTAVETAFQNLGQRSNVRIQNSKSDPNPPSNGQPRRLLNTSRAE